MYDRVKAWEELTGKTIEVFMGDLRNYGLVEAIFQRFEPKAIVHYDEIFGTALNRFCVQACCGLPLTPYGKGKQKRGFLNMRDTLCFVELAMGRARDGGNGFIFIDLL